MKLRTINMTEPLKDIKTNIITGFLGVGKSTAILDLLAQKPEKERWAVLVNEFGEIGIDGGLFANHQDPNIFIREVPGGCMCCATGLPMQIAMSMLLARARPERLIIEPTGLGHPVEVMSVLAADHFHELLDLRSTLTLVDARVINDQRYTSHDTFNQQLDIADIVVASKRDLYGKDDFKMLEEYLSGRDLTPKRQLVSAQQGHLDMSWLSGVASAWREKPITLKQPPESDTPDDEVPSFPPEGFICLSNSGEGFTSHGWLFQPDFTFRRDQITELFRATNVDRLKAILKTNAGHVGFNFSGDHVAETALQDLPDSRVEIIASGAFSSEAFETSLLACCYR